jgi:lipopolysaccharide/colanic/teichoic acid biosynthesis glycosyltransferase
MVAEAPRLGPGLTHRDDPRITAVGRILRKTKFDEFPQVINVLKGDMSIIGPRPEAPQYAEAYPKDFKSILQMRPGLTSLAQVTHRNEEQMLPAEDTEDFYLSVILPRKLSMDMYYADHWSLGLDLRVFLLGVLALLKVAPPAWLWPADVVVSLPAEDPRIMSSRN